MELLFRSPSGQLYFRAVVLKGSLCMKDQPRSHTVDDTDLAMLRELVWRI